MANDEIHEKLLNAAKIGGDSDGRLLLHHIISLLTHGYEGELDHGLLPKEYVNYLIDTLSFTLASPKQADKIFKISKPKHREKEINIFLDGAIAYLCVKAKKDAPGRTDEDIFGNLAIEITEDHKALISHRTNQNDISLKSVERIYKKYHPIISQFKNIEGYKWIIKTIKGEPFNDIPNDISLSEAKIFINLIEEINQCQFNMDVLKSIPTSDDELFAIFKKACIEDMFINYNK